MLFNTLQFLFFFAIVYTLYLFLSHKWQNRILLVASYVFYGAWDWRFLFLILISTLLDYICGLKIHEAKERNRKRIFLFFSVFGNLSILGFFKYYNFFVSNLEALLSYFGLPLQPQFLNIILPVGISFYTFQTMSYTIDVYRGTIKPTKQFFDFALFVAFFPQLVAGPIERAGHLLPQILSPRKINVNTFYEGCHLIFWGLFQKVFIADNLAKIVDPVFAAPPPYDGIEVLCASYAFAFQIFCDFAGYSNIARGLGKCMGFDIMINFNLPYFAPNPREFWRRWHISLSSWFRDYLYIPLGGNKGGAFKTYRNVAITMLLGGLWHGASWKFVVWGAYHGVLLIMHRLLTPLFDKVSLTKSASIKQLWFLIKVIVFFHLICLGWLLFRAHSITQVGYLLQGLLFNFDVGFSPALGGYVIKLIFFTWVLILIQCAQVIKKEPLVIPTSNFLIKAVFYAVCYYLIIVYGVTGGEEFIYFQF
ncbi:MAG: MBOAT family O-acyltransferase [Pseudomonadota bacterium]